MLVIDYEKQRKVVAEGLNAYLKIPVIQSNQNAPLPKYPFISFTITTLMSKNNGTYSVYDEDGIEVKGVTQTWSISVLSDKNDESVMYANKAREWLDNVGTTYLNDNDIIVQNIGGITNRDNVITVEYEYKNGFDVVFQMYDKIITDPDTTGWIEQATINETEIIGETYDEYVEKQAKRLQTRLEGDI